MTIPLCWWRLWKAAKAMREARRCFGLSMVHVQRAREILAGTR